MVIHQQCGSPVFWGGWVKGTWPLRWLGGGYLTLAALVSMYYVVTHLCFISCLPATSPRVIHGRVIEMQPSFLIASSVAWCPNWYKAQNENLSLSLSLCFLLLFVLLLLLPCTVVGYCQLWLWLELLVCKTETFQAAFQMTHHSSASSP